MLGGLSMPRAGGQVGKLMPRTRRLSCEESRLGQLLAEFDHQCTISFFQ